MTTLAIAGAPRALWYLTRGAGAVTLVGLTATTALGIVGTLRWSAARWPRFVLDALHRNLALVTVCVLALHVLTAVLDGFAPIGLLDAVVPFAGRYRPLYLGFGALALDVLVAVGVTSLLRGRLGHRAWRTVHWAAYGAWPIAMVHALGIGSDAQLGWMLVVGLACLAVVLAAAGRRLVTSGRWAGASRALLAAGVAVPLAAVGAWAAQGPLAPGWARRAGTPAALLRPRSVVSTADVTPNAFAARISGTVRSSTSEAGQTVVDLPLTLTGGRSGTLDLRLVGQPLAGGGVQLSTGRARLRSGATYRGPVTRLEGSSLVAVVQGPGATLRLRVALSVDQARQTVTGRVRATPVTA